MGLISQNLNVRTPACGAGAQAGQVQHYTNSASLLL